MDSSFFLTFVAAAIGFITFRKFRSHQENQEIDSSPSLSTSSVPPSSLSISSVPPSSSPHHRTHAIHDVFPSFRGEDVRRNFLSHIQKEFQRKAITPFNDNGIKRGESIGPELIRAIRGSKIAIVLLSRNYASSKWCLDELVEIMKCREELGQTVLAIFYRVDPSDVKKLAGDFGKVFKNTCAGKTKEVIEGWRQALVKVATIAGYDSSNWDSEAAMIERIATDVSNELFHSVRSRDLDSFVGMRAHLEKMEPLLFLGSNEVRMIGILGPSGIGKSTIARVIYSQYSHQFQLTVFLENVKRRYTRPCYDEYSAKLKLQKDFLSEIFNQEDIKNHHNLGVVSDRLKDKRVLVVLDDVDHLVQLDAMAQESWWFGPGSRIIITTQYRRILNAQRINHIYEVGFPPDDEALEIFCLYAFGQKSPYDGFENLAKEVTHLAGKLPLGLRVMGSHFKERPRHEWTKELPRLRATLDGEIESILKFSFDALCDEEKALFLYIACFFNGEAIEKVEAFLAEKFFDVESSLRVLAEKSLISIEWRRYINMHTLLARLGTEIVRKQSINEPEQRQFLVDARDICQVLRNDSVGRSVIGIDLDYNELGKELKISERAFERMYNVQFLRFAYQDGHLHPSPHIPENLNCLPREVRLLHWEKFPMTCLPSTFNPEFLVEIVMRNSKLEKLWEGIKTIKNLKWMDLSGSSNLKELPDLSTATNLIKLKLSRCSSLVELPSSIGNMTNLLRLYLNECSSLVELPSSLGNMDYLEQLYLNGCSSLVELPSCIGNLHKLQKLCLNGCSKLKALPINLNLKALDELDLTDCSLLKIFPEISTNIRVLCLTGTAIEEIPPSIRSFSRLRSLDMSYSENLRKSQHAFDCITELHCSDTRIQEIAPWVKEMSRLHTLVIRGCTKLVSLPQLPESLAILDAGNCESLERLDCSFYTTKFIDLNFIDCFKLNQEARDLITNTSVGRRAVFPGDKVPTYFTYRATGSSLSVKSNGFDTQFPKYSRFQACVLLTKKVDVERRYWSNRTFIYCKVKGHFYSGTVPYKFSSSKEHLFVIELGEIVISTELVFEFGVNDEEWEIKECGIRPPETLAP